MKKRSLVAAIAMLVVSAIVLTSSTYAWFASNGAATVGTMSATVSNNAGTLRVKATLNAANANADYKTALVAADYNGYTTDLAPVSMSIANASAPAFYKVAYDGVKFSAGSTGNSNDYLTYGFDVNYDNGGESAATIKITPTWADTSGFCYALVKVTVGNSDTYYMYGGNGYTPVTAVSGDIQDDGSVAGVIEFDNNTDTDNSNATQGTLAGATQGASGTAITFSAAAGTDTTANVTVIIWAEGQDPQCTGISAAGNATLSFSISDQ